MQRARNQRHRGPFERETYSQHNQVERFFARIKLPFVRAGESERVMAVDGYHRQPAPAVQGVAGDGLSQVRQSRSRVSLD